MRINLRRADRLVTEKFLDASQVRPVVQQVRGKRVSKRVRADRRIEAALHEVFVELAPDATSAQPLAVLVDEVGAGFLQRVAPVADRFRSRSGE